MGPHAVIMHAEWEYLGVAHVSQLWAGMTSIYCVRNLCRTFLIYNGCATDFELDNDSEVQF
jgi:hypothetical protein